MGIYFTADSHFGHTNIIKHCNRPFESIEEMNETLIANWNSRVHKSDHVYIAGDFCWRGGYENALRIVKRLKGNKHLAIGNHDSDFLKKPEYRELFAEIGQILVAGLDNGRTICCHYPMASWQGSHRGNGLVYGHIHNHINEVSEFMMKRDNAFNAGVDICQFMPVTFKELQEHNNSFKEMYLS